MNDLIIDENELYFNKTFCLRITFIYNEKNVSSLNYLINIVNNTFPIEEQHAYVKYYPGLTEVLLLVKTMSPYSIRKKNLFDINNPDLTILLENFPNSLFECLRLLEFLQYKPFN